MQILNIIFGLVTIVSFAFALWQSHKMKIREKVEGGKIAVSTQRIKQAFNTAHNIAYVADMIVQRSKLKDEISISELQSLGRAVRAQAFVLLSELRSEHAKMKDWKYGVMVSSEEIIENIADKEQDY